MTAFNIVGNTSDSNIIPFSNNQVSHEKPQYTPFCGRRFKVLRIAGHTLASLITALAYKILSIACWITFQRDKARMYSDWSSYKLNNGLSRPFSYLCYGKKIINFAYNSIGMYRIPINESLSKKELLKEFYGDTFEEMMNRYHSDRIPIDESKLDFYPINKGICLGESLDFISRFLNSGQTVEEISQHFEKGGTVEAQITQIIVRSQNTQQIFELRRAFAEERAKERECILEELKLVTLANEKAKNRLLEEAKNISDPNARKEFIANKLVEIKEDCDRYKQLLSDFEFKEIGYTAKMCSDQLEPLGRMNGLDLNLEKIILDENLSRNDDPEGLLEDIKSLPSGAYLTLLKNEDKDRQNHAIVFIKDLNRQHVLFDSNFATLKMDGDTDLKRTLWDISKAFYNTHGECKIYIYSCQASA